jgi:hypothetical protein
MLPLKWHRILRSFIQAKRARRGGRLIAAALLPVAVAAGCMTSTRMDSGVTWVSPGEHRIVAAAADFKSTRPIRVKYTDSWQTEIYALFRANGRQCEMIFAEARRNFTVALDYQIPIKEMVATWNLNSRQNLVWGALGRIDHFFKTWFYRPYELRDLQRSCFGFVVEWDQIYEDPRGRPGKVLFGYFCGARGEILENPEIRALIRDFSVRMPGKSTGTEKAQSIHSNGSGMTAITAARAHGPFAESGNPNFPFMLARYYSLSRGGEKP